MLQAIELIFRSLRELDAEATSFVQGFPTGLRWYHAHLYPNAKRDDSERDWTRELSSRLSAKELPTCPEYQYPAYSETGRCDLRVQTLPGSYFWIEIKGAWKYLNDPAKRAVFRNSNYRKHLDNMAADVARLNTLRTSDASMIGLLLLGFYKKSDPMDEDIRGFVQKADIANWPVESICWDDRNPDSVAHCWLWYRHLNLSLPKTPSAHFHHPI